jgi:hypothetical protein
VVFEERVLKIVFGPKREEVTGDWRKLRNQELQGVCFSTNSLRVIKWKRMRWLSHVARMREKRNIYRVLVRKTEGKKTVGRPRRRWEHNIKVGLQDAGWEEVNYLCLAQDGNNLWVVVNTAVSLLVP